MSNLTPKQEKAIQEYLINGGNKTQAYKSAYSTSNMKEETITNKAYQLFKRGDIRARLEELQKKQAKKHDITKDKVLKQLCDIAFLDIGRLADEKGKIKDIQELDEHTRRLLQGAELKSLGSGDNSILSMSYKLSDKLKAIEMINKMLGYNEPEKIEQNQSITFVLSGSDAEI